MTTWQDATLAAALFAVDPTIGLSVRALPGPVRERFLNLVADQLPLDTRQRRLPHHVADDRLLGGLDLPATLKAGRPIAARGLLAEADSGIVVVTMAERVSAAMAARLGAVLDTGEVVAERDGLTLRSRSAIGVIALDEGIAEDEQPPGALCDRLALRVALADISVRDAQGAPDRAAVVAARALLPSVTLPDDVLEALCTVAGHLGIASMRAMVLVVRAARAAAALAGRTTVEAADAVAAARLVLAPRAITLPEDRASPPEPGPNSENHNDDGSQAPDTDAQTGKPDQPPLGEILLEATRAALPPGLLAQLVVGQALRARQPAGRGLPQLRAARGRPVGTRPGEPRAGARLNLVDTLRAAAPWQELRRRALIGEPPGSARVLVRPDDFRITRFRARASTTTIFVVDASGSAALNRLAEAKGAVELVLADCYVRRDRAALIAFRGAGAELLLPPTGSLVRAKRSLAGLPGGGGTPLAAGIEAAFALANGIRRKGETPVVILLSDGRANLSRDGRPGRAAAEADALTAGRLLKEAAIICSLVDTSPRPAPQARRLADAMGALYVPLPYANAAALSLAVQFRTRG